MGVRLFLFAIVDDLCRVHRWFLSYLGPTMLVSTRPAALLIWKPQLGEPSDRRPLADKQAGRRNCTSRWRTSVGGFCFTQGFPPFQGPTIRVSQTTSKAPGIP